MENPNNNCTDWQTIVRCFSAGGPPGYVETSRNIPEKVFCVNMPGMPGLTPGPLGRPIDANMAVNLISDFYTAVNDAHGPEDSQINKLPRKKLLALYQQSRAFLSMLGGIDYGMSVDKDFALKLLSQPKCEGLRGYLCYKKDNPDAPISLVTVGIDSDGYDLRYNQSNTVVYGEKIEKTDVLPPINGAPPLKDVTMQSLGGEYVTPPYTFENIDLVEGEKEHINEKNQPDGQDRFVLLNIATGQKELLKFK